jgi:hypothetical protein
MVDILGFIEELKHIKDLLCKGKLLAQKETYDVLRVVQKLIRGYEKQVDDFEKAHVPFIIKRTYLKSLILQNKKILNFLKRKDRTIGKTIFIKID